MTRNEYTAQPGESRRKVPQEPVERQYNVPKVVAVGVSPQKARFVRGKWRVARPTFFEVIAMPPDCGVLLVGHGSRNSAAIAAVYAIGQLLAEAIAPAPVQVGFLELAEPTIEEALVKLAQAGIQSVVIAPLLLFAAGHAKQDIPEAVEAARVRRALPKLTIRQAAPLGLHPAVVELSRQRFAESLQGLPEVRAKDTCLLLVGRGSSDARAAEEFEQFARERLASGEMAACRVAYVAIGKPSVAQVLSQVAREAWQRVVIQPHLLFPGEVHDTLVRTAAAIARPGQEWVVAPLVAEEPKAGDAPTDLLIRAIMDRIRETG
jgi:sirohydrochlorin cobaltochelatase